MTTNHERNDDQFAATLIEFDERIRQRGSIVDVDRDGPELLPANGLDARLARAQRCVLLLELTRLEGTEAATTPLHENARESEDTAATRHARPSDLPMHGKTLPRKLDRFEIVDFLGEGGYGVVYLAHDPNVDRLVALKIPRTSPGASKNGRQRFLREAKLTAALNHRNIATLLEAGTSGESIWIATEFCDGIGLAELIADSPAGIPPRQAANIVAQLVDGVAHAHACGILHRDIKPGNVVLVPTAPFGDRNDDRPGNFDACVPKLLDFGLRAYPNTEHIATPARSR